ncbi:MAG: MarR family transcriptional regulator [Terracidiphilus sp.]
MNSLSKRTRQELLRQVGQELGREISAQSIFFHEIVAQKLGLNATDTKCLGLISGSGTSEVTAGDLGRITGLTTGAVTGILDRLEAAGLVERVRDVGDRRRVFVRPKPEAAARLEKLYQGLGEAMTMLVSGYKTSELELICEFLERNLAILQEQIARLS